MSPALTVVALWIYVTLLMVGGLIGLIKAGSKISLVTSSIFSLLLALCVLGFIRPFYVADILVGFLAIFFSMRFVKGRKFMPAGLIAFCSFIVLAVLILAPLQVPGAK